MTTSNDPELPFVLADDSSSPAPQLFAEGTVRSLIGPLMTKVTFHVVEGRNDAGKEIRKPVLQLNMSTATWIEVCRNTLGAIAANEGPIKQAMNEAMKTMFPESELTSAEGTNLPPRR